MGEFSGLTNSEVSDLCQPADISTKVILLFKVIVDLFPQQCNFFQNFLFQQTMYRIKDPKKSLPFYTGVLGMTLLQKYDFPDAKFSLYFMGYENPADVPTQNAERSRWAMSRKATLELTQ